MASPAPQKPTGKKHVRPKALARKASVIIPSTGVRIHRTSTQLPRNYTLGRTNSNSTTSADDTTPLLGGVRGGGAQGGRGGRGWGSGAVMSLLDGMVEFFGSQKGHMVLKCSFGYFLGSLATFVSPIAAMLGKYDGKHMVATCAVYFHPARSIGGMFEATLYALCAFAYSTVVSVGSMGLSNLFAQLDMIELGHALVLLIFCAGGLGLIGYTKQAMASPTVSVACSLASIAIITILTKEGNVQRGGFTLGKIYQVSTIVVMAISISLFLALTLWATSAVTELRQLMIKSTDSFSDMLTIITRSFLSGTEEELLEPQFVKASTSLRTVFVPLMKNLREAKYEHYVRGTEREYVLEKKIVECMQRLAQHIGGLRSAASTQFGLLSQAQKLAATASAGTPAPGNQQRVTGEGPQLFTPPDHDSYLAVPEPLEWPASDATSIDTQQDPTAPLTIFDTFIFHLGPPMKSLAYTLNLMLEELPFSSSHPIASHTIKVNPAFSESLKKAVELYSEARIEALNTLYKSEAVTKERPMDEAADVEEIAASCGYFSSCLLYFAEEMGRFLSLLEELEHLQREGGRTWEWLKFWKKPAGARKQRNDVEELGPSKLKARNTIPNVAPEAEVPFTYKLWKAMSVLRRDEIKFSIKVGVGAAVYALPAFIPYTRPIYSHWRGEWGLVSYMIVMSMTLGQTNNSGNLRVLGTIFGAIFALVAWETFGSNPYTLSIFGWLVSIPCFWIILTWKQATFGRFILLTYNLSVLYAYSLSMADADDDDDEGGVDPVITEIVLHRFVAVTVGVIWGVFVNVAVWPISARQQLRRGLSVLWLRMALIWRRDPLNSLIEGESDKKYMNIHEEHALQKALLRLGTLVAAAPHELRLKGPFPAAEYQKILAANQAILDAFHGMSVMIMKDPKANRREADILEFTMKERVDLCARISHLFYVLASSIRLGFPLPERLPNTDRARDRLLAKLYAYRQQVRGTEGESDEDFALIYAYVLVTGRISEGVYEVIQIVERLYGVLEEEMLEI
ncbi:hypothetical protein P167DRAFT_532133 [Morchella conica CCBAS932]|uniref:Integral membrane bound transporter domain-containing protein n=1 Tax=Morchella conica CCBAS932 TaxID=1392247 RepID=A0A3N4L184_9PEZI|nr:hypothetical protein P167DRAFT_532133 [Morchella conica CCBAS932]